MALRRFIVALILCTFTTCICAELLQHECQNKCETSYPLHTYPYAEYLTACKRGCRLNAISQLTEPERGPEVAELACENGCKEAYGDEPDSEYACSYGCKHQKLIPSPAQILQNRDEDDEDLSPHVILHPVLMLGSFCRGLVDRTSYYVQYSSSYYYSNGDGDTVVINYQSPAMLIEPGSPGDDLAQPVSLDYEDEATEKRSSDEDAIPMKMLNHGKKWLHCVSYKSGLPPWLVAGTLLLSSFFLIWLCCATTSTAPKYHAKVLTMDDVLLLEKEELKANKKIIPLSIVDTPEAGPLPVKVLIDDSQI